MKSKTPTIGTPCSFGKNVTPIRQDEDAGMPFHGFPASVGQSPYAGFCSFVMNSVSSCLKEKPKKRMTRQEAEERKNIVEICKKVSIRQDQCNISFL